MDKRLKWIPLFLIIIMFTVACQSTETIEVIGEAVVESSEEIEKLEEEIKELANDGEREIVIGGKYTAEQYILVEILSQIIEEHTDLFVKKEFGIDGTVNLHQALVNGDIDMYPEYSGTGWILVIKEELINDEDELFESVKKAYKEEYNIIWTEAYGFTNKLGLAMKRDKAESMGIETISDLKDKSKELKFGAEYDFYEREDGFTKLTELYELNFQEKKKIDPGLKYKAVKEGEIHVINVFLTDGILKEDDMKLLEDDGDFFQSYKAATLVRNETLENFPELEPLLNKLAGQITEEDIIEMNYKVEIEKQNPEDIAEEFLQRKGFK